jgi:hypothetical protein
VQRHKASLEEDVQYLKASSLIREELKSQIYAYLFDIKTGKLTDVSEL